MNDCYYIEKFYNDGSIVETTNNYNKPLLIQEEDKLIGFRFFKVKSDGSINYTGMYYFGKRITYNELVMTVEDDVIKKMQLECLERRGVKETIFCDKTYKIIYDINEDDKTIEEVKLDKLKEKARMIFIDQLEFLNIIKNALEEHNNKIKLVMEDSFSKLVDLKDIGYIDDIDVVIREYSLYVDEYLLLKSSSIVKGRKLGIKNKDTYIRLSDALDLVKSLYQEYPYLEFVINNYLLELLNNNKDILEENKITTKKKRRKV